MYKIKQISSALALGSLAFLSVANASPKSLVIGVEASRAPFVYIDNDTHNIIGFEIELLTEIAKNKGYEPSFSNMPFDALLPSVLTEQVDLAVSCIAITDERSKIVDFVGPYYEAGLNAMVRTEFQSSIKSSYDLQGHSICVVAGTTCEEFAQNIKNVEIHAFASESDSYNAIANGQCDFLIADAPVIKYSYLKDRPGRYYSLKNNLTSEEFGIMASKLRPELKNEIMDGFKHIVQNGTYDKLYKKWFNN